jgi:hypothetical protein
LVSWHQPDEDGHTKDSGNGSDKEEHGVMSIHRSSLAV